MDLSKEELAICETHLGILEALIIKMRLDINSISEKKTELDEKIKFYKDEVPCLGKLIVKLFLTKQEEAIKKKSSQLNCLHGRLLDDYFVFAQELEKIKSGDIVITPEHVNSFFTWLTKRFINNPSIPSKIPTELWELKINARKRAGISFGSYQSVLTFIKFLDRPGYA